MLLRPFASQACELGEIHERSHGAELGTLRGVAELFSGVATNGTILQGTEILVIPGPSAGIRFP